MNIVLWIVQGLLALAFLLAGFMKTFMPVETLKKNMAWVRVVPAPFVRFIRSLGNPGGNWTHSPSNHRYWNVVDIGRCSWTGRRYGQRLHFPRLPPGI